MNLYGNGMWVKLLSVAVVFAFLISGAAIALSSDISEPSEITLAKSYVPGTEWVKSGVVLDIGGAGQESHVTTPSVLKLADGTYAMWYVGMGTSGYKNIYKAVSQDGITWTKAGLALAYGEAYATVGVMYPFVRLTDEGGYDMWYAAYDGSRNTRILRATSTDGVSWTKLGTQLIYGSTYDPAGLNSPRVYYDGTQWHMWYSACRWTPNRGWVCHAHRATENDAWVKDGMVLANDTALDSFSAGVQWIVPNENGYDMFYGGRGPDQYPGRILHAHSADGLTWTKTGLVIDRTLPGESYMADYPSVIFEDGKFRMWYVGYDGVNSRIYYAETAAAEPEPTETVDLSIADQDLSVSDSELTAGTPVTVTATVHGDPSVSTSSSEKALVFSDDFGSGTLSKWIKTSWNPSGLLEVSSAVSNTTPYSLHCQSDPGTNTGPYVMKFLDGAYSHSITETMFYLPTKAQSIDKWDIIRVGSSTGTVFSTTNYEFYIALRDDDYSIDLFEYVKDASGVWSYGCLAMDVYELTPQTWNKISLEITPTDYALRVGETTVASGERAASTLIHHVLLGDEGGSAGCWGDSYWDDVKVWSVTESQVSEPGLDATCSVEFYLDAVDPVNLITTVENVAVPAGGQTPVSIEWTPVAGEHQIIAVATNVVPEDRDYSNNQASVSVSVAESGPAEITVQKVKLSGIDEGFTHTYYEWELQITVANIGSSAAENVMVFDVLPAELELLDIVPSTGSTESFGPVNEGTRAAPTPDTILPQKSTHITWAVGTLEPGQSETLYMMIGTRLNPAGKQEFTSPGTYILNEGAYAIWTDSQTGTETISAPAPAITVEISEYPINVIENPQVPLPKTWFFMIMSFGCFVPGLARKRKQ